MKKIVAVALFIFWAIVVALLSAWFLSLQNPTPTQSKNGQGNLSPVAAGKTLDQAEVAKHNLPADCWLLIDGKVYGVSSYLSAHPGGRDNIIKYCGQEASAIFAGQGGHDHSDYAYNLLKDYYLGDFGQTTTVNSPALGLATTSPSDNVVAVNNSVTPAATLSGSTVLDKVELAKHDSAANCWLLIDGGVYSVSSYLNAHPGGRGAIIPYCGKEASALFAGQGGHAHSNYAYSLLKNYYLGKLGQRTTAALTKPVAQPVQAPAAAKPAPIATQPGVSVVLSASEVAKHNTRNDCWMIISGNVYSLASYMNAHPGGVAMIQNNCGKDGTAMYQTKGGGGGNHSGGAYSQLANYLIGKVGAQTTSTQIDQAMKQGQSASQQLPQGGENEFEDEREDEYENEFEDD